MQAVADAKTVLSVPLRHNVRTPRLAKRHFVAKGLGLLKEFREQEGEGYLLLPQAGCRVTNGSE